MRPASHCSYHRRKRTTRQIEGYLIASSSASCCGACFSGCHVPGAPDFLRRRVMHLAPVKASDLKILVEGGSCTCESCTTSDLKIFWGSPVSSCRLQTSAYFARIIARVDSLILFRHGTNNPVRSAHRWLQSNRRCMLVFVYF
jgi:hypothetical protein